MKTTLNTANYQHLTEIDFFGHIYKSTYNHNYYYSDLDCDLILEVCDDNNCYQYYRIEDGRFTEEYLGLTYGAYGIFDKECEYHKNVTLDSSW